MSYGRTRKLETSIGCWSLGQGRNDVVALIWLLIVGNFPKGESKFEIDTAIRVLMGGMKDLYTWLLVVGRY